jgi:hypothetical protein
MLSCDFAIYCILTFSFCTLGTGPGTRKHSMRLSRQPHTHTSTAHGGNIREQKAGEESPERLAADVQESPQCTSFGVDQHVGEQPE